MNLTTKKCYLKQKRCCSTVREKIDIWL